MRFEQTKNWLDVYVSTGWMDDRAIEGLNQIVDRNKVAEIRETITEYLGGPCNERAEKIIHILDLRMQYLDECDVLGEELNC